MLKGEVIGGQYHAEYLEERQVRTRLDFMAGGETVEAILAAYPQLKPEDIRAAIAYGAEVARERVIPVPVAVGE